MCAISRSSEDHSKIYVDIFGIRLTFKQTTDVYEPKFSLKTCKYQGWHRPGRKEK